jgi:cytochrome bd-type quinol oxidase subunit 2
MIQIIKNNITKILVAFALLVPLLVPATVMAIDDNPNIRDSLCAGADLNVNSDENCAASTDGAGREVNDLIALVINIFSIVVGVVAVIMIIIGGLKYITSSGDSNNVTSAKNTILYAIIGLVVVALAQFIVKFVLAKATGNGE